MLFFCNHVLDLRTLRTIFFPLSGVLSVLTAVREVEFFTGLCYHHGREEVNLMDEITMQPFPRNEVEALAMLYVQNQDLSDITPEDLVNMYDNAYETISALRKSQHDSQIEWL